MTITNFNTGQIFEGFAGRITDFLFDFTPSTSLPDGVYFVSADVVIFDGQTPNAQGFTQLSQPLWVTIDTLAPTN